MPENTKKIQKTGSWADWKKLRNSGREGRERAGEEGSASETAPTAAPEIVRNFYRPSYSRMVSCDSICLTVSMTTETTMSKLVPPMAKDWMPVK